MLEQNLKELKFGTTTEVFEELRKLILSLTMAASQNMDLYQCVVNFNICAN